MQTVQKDKTNSATFLSDALETLVATPRDMLVYSAAKHLIPADDIILQLSFGLFPLL